jgi:hypothetical protein
MEISAQLYLYNFKQLPFFEQDTQRWALDEMRRHFLSRSTSRHFLSHSQVENLDGEKSSRDCPLPSHESLNQAQLKVGSWV